MSTTSVMTTKEVAEPEQTGTIEERIANAMAAHGWVALRNGWPDLLCYRQKPDGTSEILAVEVKDSRTGDCLRPAQIKNHMILNAAGLKVVVVKGVEECTDDMIGQCSDSIDEYTTAILMKTRERLPQAEKMLENFTKSIDRRRWELLQDMDRIEERYKAKAQRIAQQLKEIEETLSILSSRRSSK
jgi:predicted ribosome quality control (RQC) complex YloA/Tae2 family protein